MRSVEAALAAAHEELAEQRAAARAAAARAAAAARLASMRWRCGQRMWTWRCWVLGARVRVRVWP